MYYHFGLIFDYAAFSREVKPISFSIENGELSFFNARISKIVFEIENTDLLTSLGFGEPPKGINPITSFKETEYFNSEVGKRLFLFLSTFLHPSPVAIGLNWRKLISILETAGWKNVDIETLIYGRPVGTLVTEQAKYAVQLDVVTHNDPYWRWIRPQYSYNQGGWVSYHECKMLYEKLNNVLKELPTSHSCVNGQKEVMKIVFDAKEMVRGAIDEHKGLYVIVLWEGDELS